MLRRVLPSLGLIAGLACASAAQAGSDAVPLPFKLDKESREISVVVDKGLRSMRGLPNSLRIARRAMLDKEPVTPEQLRALADRRDTLAALRYVDVLMEQGPEANPSDIAFYASIAVGGGRVWALPEMVAAMHKLDPATEPKARVNQYIRVLYPHAWAGNTLALDAVIDFNGEGRLFGKLSNSTRQKIEAQLEQLGDGRGDLKIAIELLSQDTITAEDLDRARLHLQRAAQADHLAVATTAANLIEQMTQRAGDMPAVTN